MPLDALDTSEKQNPGSEARTLISRLQELLKQTTGEADAIRREIWRVFSGNDDSDGETHVTLDVSPRRSVYGDYDHSPSGAVEREDQMSRGGNGSRGNWITD